MGYYGFYLGFIPQIIALIHFFRNRPEGYWFWIILFFGPLGAVIYFFAVVFSGTPGSVEDKFRASMKEKRKATLLQNKINAGEALPYDYSELGEILFKMKKYSLAIEALTEAVKKTPTDLEARFYLGLSLEQLTRFEEAGRQLEPLIMKDSKFKFGEAMLALARCYRGAGEIQAATGAFKKVLSQNNFAEARYSLAELLLQLDKNDEAKEHLQRIITESKTTDLPKHVRRVEKKWVKKARTLFDTLK